MKFIQWTSVNEREFIFFPNFPRHHHHHRHEHKFFTRAILSLFLPRRQKEKESTCIKKSHQIFLTHFLFSSHSPPQQKKGERKVSVQQQSTFLFVYKIIFLPSTWAVRRIEFDFLVRSLVSSHLHSPHPLCL